MDNERTWESNETVSSFMRNSLRLIIVLFAAVIAAGGLTGQKPATTFHTSNRLRPMASDLASSCYLFQGLPDGVVGTKFAYSSREHLRGEDALDFVLKQTSGKGKIGMPEALKRVCRSIYLDRNQRPFLILTDTDRKKFVSALDGPARKGRWTIEEELLRLSLLHYLEWNESTRPRSRLKQIHAIKGKLADVVAKNVEAVSSRLSIGHKVGQGWEHPYVAR
ncbi:MAG: hypothetical protein ABL949_06005 [Fimbriimonadaceae bacterium]